MDKQAKQHHRAFYRRRWVRVGLLLLLSSTVVLALLPGDSRLIFIDEKISPTYRSSILFREFRIEGIDTGDPDKDSPVQLKVGIGEDAAMDLRGTARFFDQRGSAKLGGRIEGLALPPL